MYLMKGGIAILGDGVDVRASRSKEFDGLSVTAAGSPVER